MRTAKGWRRQTAKRQSSWADCGRMSREVMGHTGADLTFRLCEGLFISKRI